MIPIPIQSRNSSLSEEFAKGSVEEDFGIKFEFAITGKISVVMGESLNHEEFPVMDIKLYLVPTGQVKHPVTRGIMIFVKSFIESILDESVYVYGLFSIGCTHNENNC